jgi:hypothetical protein
MLGFDSVYSQSPNPGESHEPIFKTQCKRVDHDVEPCWVCNVAFFTATQQGDQASG